MRNIEIAIDLGGANTSLYINNNGLVLKEPTLVSVIKQEKGYKIDCFGIEAKKKLGKTDSNTIIFSPISNGIIKSKEYCSLLLAKFLSGYFKPSEFGKLTVVITYPCGLSFEEKQEYEDVCYKIGLKNVLSVPNVLCSALGCGVDIENGKSTVMVDIGATATDVASINCNSIVKGATVAIGGKSMDLAIKEHIENNFNLIISLATAQRIKEEIATLLQKDNKRYEIVGTDVNTNTPRTIFISSSDIYYSIVGYVDDIIKVIRTTINSSPADVIQDIIKYGIIVSGGVSNLPYLETYLKKELNIPVFIADEKENACILGAGTLLSNKKQLEKLSK